MMVIAIAQAMENTESLLIVLFLLFIVSRLRFVFIRSFLSGFSIRALLSPSLYIEPVIADFFAPFFVAV